MEGEYRDGMLTERFDLEIIEPSSCYELSEDVQELPIRLLPDDSSIGCRYESDRVVEGLRGLPGCRDVRFEQLREERLSKEATV